MEMGTWSPWRTRLGALAAVYCSGKGGAAEAGGISHTTGLEITLNSAQSRGQRGKGVQTAGRILYKTAAAPLTFPTFLFQPAPITH